MLTAHLWLAHYWFTAPPPAYFDHHRLTSVAAPWVKNECNPWRIFEGLFGLRAEISYVCLGDSLSTSRVVVAKITLQLTVVNHEQSLNDYTSINLEFNGPD